MTKALKNSAAYVRQEPKAKKRKARNTKSIYARHDAMVDKSAGLFGCWNFTGSIQQQSGYGQVHYKCAKSGKVTKKMAHVVAWESANGCEVPKGMVVRHTCHNPLCQNPAHLLLGTAADNRADDKAAGKKAKRLTRETIEAIAKLADTTSPLAIAEQFGCNQRTVQMIWRGITHTKITGIERNWRKPGKSRASQNAQVINLDSHRKPKAHKPELLVPA